MCLPNVVRSPEWDPGRHEEIWKGPEVKIYIWEVVKRTPGSFGVIPVLYRGHRKGSGGPPGGATNPGGLRGPSVGRDQPLGGLVRLPQGAQGAGRGEGGNPRLRWA